MIINELRIENFKPFQKQIFKIKALTLLSGLNSTGKSSVIQSFLLLRQSYLQNLLPEIGLALNGDLVKIGTAKDALYEEAKKDLISFNVIWDDGNGGIWDFRYDRDSDVLKLDGITSSEFYELSLFQDNFHYLQAERICPKPYFEMSDFQVRQHQQLGSKGEYTAHFLYLYQDDEIPNKQLNHPLANSLTLKDQVEAWIGEISPGTRIKITPNSGMDLMSLQFSYGLSNDYRSTNVGFGVTYTLPIIVAVLASEPGTLILLENPEAHLHPRGQSKMGELLALAASCGVQIIIETHSDHVLNGIRLAVHDGKIEPEDVQLHYFQRQEKDRIMVSEVISPNIDKNGRIDRWPDGFFDEWRNILAKLI
jgi:predicted ATPase